MNEQWMERVQAALLEMEEQAATMLARFVRVPSFSSPPRHVETGLQQLLADQMWQMGLGVSRVSPSMGEELRRHPSYIEGRALSGRPNVWGTRRGLGEGRSLLLVGSVDTLPPDPALPWPAHDPFLGCREGGRLYGPGSAGGKGALVAALVAAEAIKRAGILLEGDITIASVVDEAEQTCQGMLALLHQGIVADGGVYLGGCGGVACRKGYGLADCGVTLEVGRLDGPVALRQAMEVLSPPVDPVLPDLYPVSLERMTYELDGPGARIGALVQLAVAPGQQVEDDLARLQADLRSRMTAAPKLSTTLGPRVLQSWSCPDEALDRCIAVAAEESWGQALQERSAFPSGACLLATHRPMPTLVLDHAPIDPGQPESLPLADLTRAALFLAAFILEWCGAVDAD